MQHKLLPVVFWIPVALAVGLWVVIPCAAQDAPPWTGSGATPPYGTGAPLPYGANGYGVVPRAPTEPGVASRPASWPATPAPAHQWSGPRYPANPPYPMYPTQPPYLAERQRTAYTPPSPPPDDRPYRGPPTQSPPTQSPPQPPPAAPAMEICETSLIVSRVGTEAVLASDLIGEIGEIVARNARDLSPEKIEAQREHFVREVREGIRELAARGDVLPTTQKELEREVLIRQLLKQQIETKLIYYDARQGIPEENLPLVEKNLGAKFEEFELPELMKRYGAGSHRELNERLRATGSSLEKQKRSFVQKNLARGWTREQINFDDEITHYQMQQYYDDHLADFETPARVRWEELATRFSDHPTEEAAYAAIARMGNMVQSGVPFAQVAQQHSNGATAADGGRRDWTDRGSLVCEDLDRALFGLPVGQLSRIIQSKIGFHIVRVVERKEWNRKPFEDVQVQIKKKVRSQRTEQQLRAYVSGLRKQIPVWTIFDERDAQLQARRENAAGTERYPQR